MQNPRPPHEPPGTERTVVADGRALHPDDRGAADFVPLADEDAALVHLIAEGLDVEAIAACSGISDEEARKKLTVLARRLAAEAASTRIANP